MILYHKRFHLGFERGTETAATRFGEDERIDLSWSDQKPWNVLKPMTLRGQLTMLKWKEGTEICQSIVIYRFLTQVFGIAG